MLEPLLAALVRKEVLVAPVRPALAGARPVRLPAGARAARGVRDALAARSQGEAPGRGRLPRRPAGLDAGRDRRGHRRPSTSTLIGGPGRRRCRRRSERRRARWLGAGRRAGRVSRGDRGCAASLRGRRRAGRRPAERAELLERAGSLAAAGNRFDAAGRAAARGATRSSRRRARRTTPPRRRGARTWRSGTRGRIEEAIELMEQAFAVLVERASRTPTLASPRRPARPRVLPSAGIWETALASGSSWRSTSPRPSGSRA